MKIIRRASERIVRVLTWNIWGWSRGKHQHGLRIQGGLFGGSLNMFLGSSVMMEFCWRSRHESG